MRRTVISFLVFMSATPTIAETYAMMLGNRQIGTLETNGASLQSTLNNTPLGVADGTFQASVTRVQLPDGSIAEQYLGVNRGGKTRDISVIRQNGRVADVTVVPANDATDLSAPDTVPADVLFPSELFARLERAGGCPAPLQMYDGRRLVAISTASTATENGQTVCDMDYRVAAGKGHLSPFNFKSLNMQLAYADGALARVTVSAGGFDVSMLRQ
ncbi:hypothetical protein AN189_01640 [Loktanella sp. 3ANDIMAR09]|uniref:hypothetical protein n=1 Tax=Loktanella sp. 3ANDIMAR09 TaxID=1225657 RepID=UPI00070827D1|nr:hypothetical protein [Loktanella sp. 3ANDIMAR09]KQI70124.1 hypothetical protein AN189_01640 [Loktanella sp. 3ANDIMAR09]